MEPIALRIKWLGKGAKIVELPIPFVSKCEKTGQVICNPIGEFDVANGERLLAIPGIEGVFELVEKVYPEGAKVAKVDVPFEAIAPKIAAPVEYYDHTCGCGCGSKLTKKPNHKFTGIPKFLLGHGGFKGKKKSVSVAAQSPTL